MRPVSRRPSPAVIRTGPNRGRAATSPAVKRPSAQAGTSCRQSTSGSSAVASRIISSRNVARCGGTVLPWKRFQLRTSTRLRYFGARPARRPAGVHALVRPRAGVARSRAPARTSSSQTSRFRFGDVPAADGYRRTERFYPLSSRLFRRSRLRLPLKAVEHLDVMRVARARARRTSCTCSGWRCRRPTCTCASARRPSSPRTTCCRGGRRPAPSCGDGCSRGSTASSSTASAAARRCAELGVDARVIPHPVYPSAATRRDDGATRARARRDPPVQGTGRRDRGDAPACRMPGCSSRATRRCRSTGSAGRERVEWRLGYLPQAELDRALSEATVAVFPYRAELDQSGRAPAGARRGRPGGRLRRRRARRAGARATAPGRVVPAGDVDALDRSGARAARRPAGARSRPRGRRPGAARADLGRGRRAASRPLPRARLRCSGAPASRR